MHWLLQAEVEEETRALYVERQRVSLSAFDQWTSDLLGTLVQHVPRLPRSATMLRNPSSPWSQQVQGLSQAELCAALRRCAIDAHRSSQASDNALALASEAAHRSLGKRPFGTQMHGAKQLCQGRLVEMQTGEGKSLTAALAAVVVASTGKPVHIITVNDYLAERDAKAFAPFYEYLGLDVGAITSEMELGDRKGIYARSITYCTGKELVFDYLKDRLARPKSADRVSMAARHWIGQRPDDSLLLRGLHFAIVDEADSVFIDEARTPLILSELSNEPFDLDSALAALDLARSFEIGRHFRVTDRGRQVLLTDLGKHEARSSAAVMGTQGQVQISREHLVVQALKALHILHRDRDYVVLDAEVQIVDEQTGRTLKGRKWEGGLHQLVEIKEGVSVSPLNQTMARITYQRFFARYVRLSGMTGTGSEAMRELWSAYRLATVVVPPNRVSRRKVWRSLVLDSEPEKWIAVCRSVQAMLSAGRPVLVGTRSVAASARISELLSVAGIPHRVLNALQDADEAATIAVAGQRGAVTVATNMAGRGTDIALGPGVAAAGGLHVILTEFHESRRVDRQLFGRAARQGDPGSAQAIVSMDDELFRMNMAWSIELVRLLPSGRLRSWYTEAMRRWIQSRLERHARRLRHAATRQDGELERLISFSGRS
jgi:preprotein translocase subunit SecA